jgi:hypothetical protein
MLKEVVGRKWRVFNIFKKPKIVFECLIPGVERLMPMIEAKAIRHSWVNRAVAEVKIARQSSEYGMKKQAHTAKCPGIFNLQRHGWVMRTWQDVTIETFGDGNEFKWASAIDQQALCKQVGAYVGFHPDRQLANYMENWPSNALRTVVKIQSPWRCIVPKGYYLMEMPVAYADENRFTTVSGFFSHEQGPAPLNPQFLWHVMEGKTLIKAGTPIAQYMLVPKDKYEMEVKTDKQATEHEFFELANNHRFIKNYAEVKRFYGEAK